MSIWDKSFDTAYTPNPSTMFGIQSLMPQATHASLASDIGTALKGFQNELSKANTNEYARQLEMMTPEQVLAMETQGLDPRTAKLGNGFIYDPEAEAIKNAFSVLKGKTSKEITGKLNRTKAKFTKEQLKQLRQGGDITVQDLLKAAGTDSAYTDLAAAQELVNALNKQVDDEALKEGEALLRGSPVSSDQVKKLWKGDSSYFTGLGYNQADSQLYADRLRQSPEMIQLLTGKLKDQYTRDQIQNSLNGVPSTDAATWLANNGFSADDGIILNDIDPASPEFARMKNEQLANDQAVIRAQALQELNSDLKGNKVNFDAFTKFVSNANDADMQQFYQSANGKKVINGLKERALEDIKKTTNWETATSVNAPVEQRNAAFEAIKGQVDQLMQDIGLSSFPDIAQKVTADWMNDYMMALQANSGKSESKLASEMKSLQTKLRDNKISLVGSADLLRDINNYITTGKVTNLAESLPAAEAQQLRNQVQHKLQQAGVFNGDKIAKDEATQDLLVTMVMNHVLSQELDTWGGNQTLGNWLKDGGHLANARSKDQAGWFGTKEFVNGNDPIVNLIMDQGRQKKLGTDTEKYIKDFIDLVQTQKDWQQIQDLKASLRTGK